LFLDVDECLEGIHECRPEQNCVNTRGSYLCQTSCPNGLKQQLDGSCTGIVSLREFIDIILFSRWGLHSLPSMLSFYSKYFMYFDNIRQLNYLLFFY